MTNSLQSNWPSDYVVWVIFTSRFRLVQTRLQRKQKVLFSSTLVELVRLKEELVLQYMMYML